MGSENLLSVGSVEQKLPLDPPGSTSKPAQESSKTKEERKRIRREARLAARTDKKKIKSEAKKQRKENASTGIADEDDKTTEKRKIKKSKKTKGSSKDFRDPAGNGDASLNNEEGTNTTSTPANGSHIIPAAVEKIVRKEKERDKNEARKIHKTNITIEAADQDLNKHKKRKRQEEHNEDIPVDKPKSEKSRKSKKTKVQDTPITSEQLPSVEAKPEKSHKKKKVKTEEPVDGAGAIREKSHKQKKMKAEVENASTVPTERSNAGEQWNPDALAGGDARKAKFLRLLGAGKSNGSAVTAKQKPHTDATAITNVQSELERQYEAGMKLKHDGGSKRRGIGA